MINEYFKLYNQWGMDRMIIQNGRMETQMQKLLSEFGEMMDHFAKYDLDDLRDDIGDQLVVLTQIAGMFGFVPEMDDRHTPLAGQSLQIKLMKTYLDLWGAIVQFDKHSAEKSVNEAAWILNKIAADVGHTAEACMRQAWDDIKDRRGYLCAETGVFIKESEPVSDE